MTKCQQGSHPLIAWFDSPFIFFMSLLAVHKSLYMRSFFLFICYLYCPSMCRSLALGPRQTWKKIFFVNSEILKYRFGGKNLEITTNLKLQQNSVNQIFNLNAFFFFPLTGGIVHYYTIYLLFTYFELFTDYEDDICQVTSNLHVQGSKFGQKIYKFCGNFF